MRIALSAALLLAACSTEEDVAAHDHDSHEHHSTEHSEVIDDVMEKMTDGGTYMVSYTTMPSVVPLDANFMVMLQVDPVDDNVASMVMVDAFMPLHGHGMNQVPNVMNMGDGMWHAENMRFHMEGLWELRIDVDGEAVVFEIDCCETGDAGM